MKAKFINYFMDIAQRTADLSHAKRLQVGAIVVKDNRVISIGYNGMPAGADNNCETVRYETQRIADYTFQGQLIDEYLTGVPVLESKPEVIHAEKNAIGKLAASTESSVGSIMFCTHAPCMECAKMIHAAKIQTLIYKYPYRDTSGVEFLRKYGTRVFEFLDVSESGYTDPE
jgi:dCMP deaminase